MSEPNDSLNDVAVHLEDVTFLRGARVILNGIHWTVRRGEFAALLGPNGCGKSTTARILLGYLWATRGRVTVEGKLFGESNLDELRKIVRLVQPNGQFDLDGDLSVREAVRTGVTGTLGAYRKITPQQEAHADEMLQRVGMGRSADNLYGLCSTGERARTLLARALVSRPALLILDEATSGLDIRGREELLAVLDRVAGEADRPTVITITHHVEESPRATTNVLLLDDGIVAAQGHPRDALTSERLSRVYDCPVELHEQDGRYFLQAMTKGWNVE